MTAPTIDAVRAWDPSTLAAAAAGIGATAGVLRTESARLAAHPEEQTTGTELAEALDRAQHALDRAARDMAEARTRVVNLADTALARGFEVDQDGTVRAEKPRGVPGLDHSRAELLTHRLTEALAELERADAAVSKALTAIEFPQTLHSEIEAYLARLVASKDVVGSLGTTVEGTVSASMIVKKGFSLTIKGTAFARFVRSIVVPLAGYGNLAKHLGTANLALREFMIGRSSGGLLQVVAGARISSLLGRIFLPLNVITGIIEVFTGGGYKGVRGWLTRGVGLAGALGAALLLVSYAHWLTLGALESAVCGTAVLVYGLWSLGNAIWDHHALLWRGILWIAKLPVRLLRLLRVLPRDPQPAATAASAEDTRVGAP